MTNFRCFQIEELADDSFKFYKKWQKVLQKGRKHCWKRRNCLLRAISPCHSVYKRLVLQTHKNRRMWKVVSDFEKKVCVRV